MRRCGEIFCKDSDRGSRGRRTKKSVGSLRRGADVGQVGLDKAVGGGGIEAESARVSSGLTTILPRHRQWPQAFPPAHCRSERARTFDICILAEGEPCGAGIRKTGTGTDHRSEMFNRATVFKWNRRDCDVEQPAASRRASPTGEWKNEFKHQ